MTTCTTFRSCRHFVKLTTIYILVYLFSQKYIDARYKRCFTCRSRGALGDCRDPFTINSTNFDGVTNSKPSIEATPCASGWCAKTIEDNFAESLIATERSCMTRPPTDNEERCSETLFENQKDRKVFLCMCYGDLCNAATSSQQVLASTYVIASLCLLGFRAITRFVE